MVTLFYTKIHNEFFIFLGVALHYTIHHIKRIRVQSILGFRLRLEQCLLVYTIKNELAQ